MKNKIPQLKDPQRVQSRKIPGIWRVLFLVSCLIQASIIQAKNTDSLDRYIQIGLKQNIVLEQRRISLENSLLALKVARSYFLPTLGFSGNYSTASGGRTIDIPVGDLFNPIYKTLNQLTQTQSYSPISNQSFNLLPSNYYDVRVQTRLALYNSDIIYNKKIQSESVFINQAEIDIYKRELVYQIKSAYYQYLNALSSMSIYQSALKLVEKNLEINESLLRNGKGLPANILRVKGERESVLAQLKEAEAQKDNAQAYFNFLLNRDLKQSIQDRPLAYDGQGNLDSLSLDISRREEINEIGHGQNIQKLNLEMKKAFWRPKINAFLDLGSQNSNFLFNSKSTFYLTGIQVDIPLFAGKRNLYSIDQAKLSTRSENLSLDYTTQQLKLAAVMARNGVKASWENYQGARAQFISSQSYFHLLDRGFREGTNTLLEYLDARNQLTSSEILMNLRYYSYLKALAQLERETASYIF